MKGPPVWRPKKRLGQHFLRDQAVIHAILSRAGFGAMSCVLEVGAGRGALTFPLASLVGHLYAVEKDPHLADRLVHELVRRGISNVTVSNQDILKTDFGALPVTPGEKIGVIGNLPYNISSPFLEKLIENRRWVSRAVLMFQAEVARRLVASPGNKAYGALSVIVQYHAEAFPLMEVAGKAFYPVPKVDSMVVKLDFEKPHPRRVQDEENLKRVVKGAFSHRRKTLLNALRGGIPGLSTEMLREAFQACRIDPGKRAEVLSIDEFLCLSLRLPGPL